MSPDSIHATVSSLTFISRVKSNLKTDSDNLKPKLNCFWVLFGFFFEHYLVYKEKGFAKLIIKGGYFGRH